MKKVLGNGKTVTYKLKFIDIFRFMSNSFNGKCRKCKCFLEHISIEDNKLIFKCKDCNRNYKFYFNKDLTNILANTYEFFDEDINKFAFLSGKGVYPYEYMDSSETFDETSLLNKEGFYSNLNMEVITDDD